MKFGVGGGGGNSERSRLGESLGGLGVGTRSRILCFCGLGVLIPRRMKEAKRGWVAVVL